MLKGETIMLKIKFIIIKAIGRFKKIIAGWAHPAQTTEIFFSGLANDNLHPEQVDGYIKKYGEKYIEKEKNLISSIILNLLHNKDNVLDIGCGTGRYLKTIRQMSLEIYPGGVLGYMVLTFQSQQ